MTTSPSTHSPTATKSDDAKLDDPKLDKNWQRLAHLNWRKSATSPLTYQTTITVDDSVSLCVEAGGNPNDTPLLLIMGLGAQLVFWTDDFVKRLIDNGFFVIRFDNRDIGLSSKIESDLLSPNQLYKALARFTVGISNQHLPVAYQLLDMVEDTVSIINTLKLNKVNILGASMGGMIAQILAARYPHLVVRLALLFTSNNAPLLQLLSPPRPAQLKMLFTKPIDNSETQVVAHGVNFIQTIGSPGFVNTKAIEQISATRYHRDYTPEGSARQFYAIISTGSIRDYSRAITAPTLILHGSEDKLVPIAHGKGLACDILNAKFVEIKGMGHDLAPYFIPFLVTQLTKFFKPAKSV